MLERGDGGLPGLAFVRPVLAGVLYRAGLKGGDKAHTGPVRPPARSAVQSWLLGRPLYRLRQAKGITAGRGAAARPSIYEKGSSGVRKG